MNSWLVENYKRVFVNISEYFFYSFEIIIEELVLIYTKQFAIALENIASHLWTVLSVVLNDFKDLQNAA